MLRGNTLYTLSLEIMASSPNIIFVNDIKELRHGLVQGLPKLKFEKDHLCSACAMGKSKKKPYKPKTEDTNQETLYSFAHGILDRNACRKVNERNFDELTAMAFEHSSLGPALHEMTPATISSRLVPTPPPSTRFVDHPAPKVIAPIAEVVALVLVVSTGSPSSTTVDQDAPSLIAHMGNDPYFGVPIPEIPSGQSSLSNSIHTIVHPDHKISEHNSK
ncbi:hypothetical protein Tco_0038413 [Tanacetum coccineum]